MTSLSHCCIIFEQLTGKSFQMNKPGKAIAPSHPETLESAISPTKKGRIAVDTSIKLFGI